MLSSIHYNNNNKIPLQRAQTEAVTFLSEKESNKNLYAIPGLDYVSHDDIIPYSVWPRDRKPLRHELFDKFLVHTGNTDISFKASETLHGWQARNHTFLELTEVHREITEGVRVTVIPFYVSLISGNLATRFFSRGFGFLAEIMECLMKLMKCYNFCCLVFLDG